MPDSTRRRASTFETIEDYLAEQHYYASKQAAGRAKVVLWATVATASLAAMTAFFSVDEKSRLKFLQPVQMVEDKRLSSIERRLNALEQLPTLPTAPASDNPSGQENTPHQDAISDLSNRHAALGLRMDRIENAIMESPEKALSLPLLRKDLESVRSELAMRSQAASVEINRIYDLAKWLAAAVASILSGILAWVATTIYNAKTRGEDKHPPKAE